MDRALADQLRDQATEEDWQATIIDYARLHKWRVFHARPARTASGWRTAMTGDAGFPDLVLARKGTVLFVEVKSAKGILTMEQEGWGKAIQPDPLYGPTWRVWRPADWPEVQETLAR